MACAHVEEVRVAQTSWNGAVVERVSPDRNRPGNAGGFDCRRCSRAVGDVQVFVHASACARGLLLEQPVHGRDRVGGGADVYCSPGRVLTGAVPIQPHALDTEYLGGNDVVLPVGRDMDPVVLARLRQQLKRAEVPEIRLAGPNALRRNKQIKWLTERPM